MLRRMQGVGGLQGTSASTAWIRGVVRHAGSSETIRDHYIELWDYLEHAPRFLAEATINPRGEFAFEQLGLAGADASQLGYELRITDGDGSVVHSEHVYLSSGENRVVLSWEQDRSRPKVSDVVPAGGVYSRHGEELSTSAEHETFATTDADDVADEGEDLTDLPDDAPSERAYGLADETGVPVEVFAALERLEVPLAPELWLDWTAEDWRRLVQTLVDEGRCGAEVLLEADRISERLCKLAVERAIEVGPLGLGDGPGAVLASLDLPPERLRRVLAAHQSRSGTEAALEWDAGDAETAGGEESSAELEAMLEVAQVIGCDNLLLRKLHRERAAGAWRTPEDLANLDFDDWCDWVEDAHRADLEAEGAEHEEAFERHVESRANAILDNLEQCYPNPFIRRALSTEPGVGPNTLRLLENAADHDLLNESIRARVQTEPQVLEGIPAEEVERALEEVATIERLSRVSPRGKEVATLFKAGLISAHDIGGAARRSFVEAHEESMGGRAQAARVHALAQHVAAQTHLIATNLAEAEHPAPMVMGSAIDRLRNVPSLRELFGNRGLCECPHCGSVYSPSAYLVDLLRYLGAASQEQGSPSLARRKDGSRRQYNPLDVLLARRPDIADIPLTCENTLTPLPYIDLVNEILEGRVANATWTPDTGKVPADVLAAVPQRVNAEAYLVLQRAVHPIGLPFHESLEVFRRYLAHLGVSRLTLMQTFGTAGAAEDLVAESLNMSLEELRLITAPGPELVHLWGAAPPMTLEALVQRLTPASALMASSGLTFAELVDLASMRYMSGPTPITLDTPAIDCDPEKVTVGGLDAQSLQRILRVVRLQRRLGWKFEELDRVLRALGNGDLDLAMLRKLVAVRELSRALELSPTELAVLWAPLDTHGKSSPYAALFRTRTVSWHVGEDRFRLRADGLELAAPGADLTPVFPALQAAFRVTNEDLLTALDALKRRGQGVGLDSSGLSALYRFVLLARALRLKSSQLAVLLRLAPSDADPFSPGDPSGALRFVALARELRDSPFTPEQVSYLFLHEIDPRQDPTPKTAQVRSVIANLRRSMVDAFAQTAQPAEMSRQVLREKLGLLLDGSLLDTAMDVLNRKSKVPFERRREFFLRHLADVFPEPEAAAQRLLGSAEPGPAPGPARSTTVTPPAEGATAGDRNAIAPSVHEDEQTRADVTFVLQHLLPMLRRRQIRGAVVQVIGDAVGLSSASTGRLLEQVLHSRRARPAPLMAEFMALLGVGLTARYYANPNLQGEPVVTRIEPELTSGWGGAAPAPGVPATNFSLELVGRFMARTSGDHVFYVNSDGTVKMSIRVQGQDREVLRSSGAAGLMEHTGRPVPLVAGTLYELRLEYRNLGTPAALAVTVGTSPTTKGPIPSTDLFPFDASSSLEEVEDGYRRVHKVAQLLTALGASDAHVAWLSRKPHPLDLDLVSTAPSSDDVARELFARFRQLSALYTLRKSLAPSATDLFEMFTAPNATEAVTRLLQATGWDPRVVAEVLGGKEFGKSSAEPLVLRLAKAIDVQRRVGVGVATLRAWSSRPPDAAMAAEVVQAVKARYDEKRWLDVAKALNDPLRAARREALVTYLLPRLVDKGVRNRGQLFEYFLIDVDMNPCMFTSRIRQAIGSVQTFFQRCLMNLELAHPRSIDASDWKWMKNYRVWEANRKVFLYPENWIEPDLRDDKSPLFANLERAILQDEIKDQNVEAAFIDYLQGLDEIARLDVRAVFFEEGTARNKRKSANPSTNGPWDGGTYHVFGRTYGPPHAWYHRRLANGEWSPWEKIEADVDGEHLLPVVFQGRLHLFWTMFRETSKQPKDNKRPKDDDPIVELGKDWDIHLAYSVYDRGRWSRKRVSDGGIKDEVSLKKYEMHDGWARFKLVEDLGSARWSSHSYRLQSHVAGNQSSLRITVHRQKVLNHTGALEPQLAEQVGEFVMQGNNGQLAPDRNVSSGGSYHSGPASRVVGGLFDKRRVHVPASRTSPRRQTPLHGPSGYSLFGQGYQATAAARALSLPNVGVGGSVAGWSSPILSAGRSVASRVLFARQTPSLSSPFFYQSSHHCFFVQPAGAASVRSTTVPLQGAFFRFGGSRSRRRGRAVKGGRGAREDWTDEASGSRDDTAESFDGGPFLEITEEGPDAPADWSFEPASDEPESVDEWEDAEDEAWHPEDAAERARPRTRSRTPGAPRRSVRPATKPTRGPVRPAVQRVNIINQRVRFVTFQHPRSADLLIELKKGGVEGLFEAASSSRFSRSNAFVQYNPTNLVDKPYPSFDLDFGLESPYGSYNWELLFHAPLLVAQRLAKEGRHEEAQRWFHFIFDPTVDDSDPSPKRFWRFLPLKRATASKTFAQDMSPAAINAWMQKPFNPHVIARLRLSAYQKAVVMKYIDNLIEWGDRLFRKDTMESIQEATQLYVLANNILGPRPERIPRVLEPEPATFRQIRDKADRFSNWAVRFEGNQVRRPFQIVARPDHRGVTQALRLELEYFCFPHNPQLDKYWDTVTDRLHKIRNCMNIQGVVRQLPLFEPPIDPGALVRAFASGADLSSVLSNLNSPPPQQRFNFLLRRALQLAEELRSFGATTLRALEKRDAEGLAQLRATNEVRLRQAIRDVGKTSVKQVEEELSEVNLQKEEVELKIQHLTAQAQQLMNPQEQASQAAMIAAKAYTVITEGIDLASKIAYAIPEFQSGGAGMSSPFVTLQLGGQMFGDIVSAVASSIQKVTDRSEVEAQMAEAQAEFQRRREQWQQEIEVLTKEKAQFDKQIAKIQLKLEVANKELRRLEVEEENAGKIQDYLRTKFSNEQLYAWMLGQLASVHFQAYKFAFDAAQQAQRAYQFELSDAKGTFIEFSYWDSLRKGLFAGERLLSDLRRLESAYLDANQRTLEIVRNVSLRQDFPLAFDELIASGRCEFDLTETLYDGDFPGHYFRRIKTVSLSIPGLAGSLLNVNCMLTMLSNKVRIDSTASGNYAASDDADDARFLTNLVPVQAIATSQPNRDSGLFELRFDDHRYLPFEGAGAISRWRLTLDQTNNPLRVANLQDVVVSVSYAARNGGAALEKVARTHHERALAQGSYRSSLRVSLREAAPQLFVQLAAGKGGEEAESKLPINTESLSNRLSAYDVRVERVEAIAHLRPRSTLQGKELTVRVQPPKGSATPLGNWTPAWGTKSLRGSAEVAGPLGEWKVQVGLTAIEQLADVSDIVICFELRPRRG